MALGPCLQHGPAPQCPKTPRDPNLTAPRSNNPPSPCKEPRQHSLAVHCLAAGFEAPGATWGFLWVCRKECWELRAANRLSAGTEVAFRPKSSRCLAGLCLAVHTKSSFEGFFRDLNSSRAEEITKKKKHNKKEELELHFISALRCSHQVPILRRAEKPGDTSDGRGEV